uniref:Uncharacterized protein n=1 Tax=Anguilla anguilla TaxID=7936 RepID=A0A0E9PI82_ANGAN
MNNQSEDINVNLTSRIAVVITHFPFQLHPLVKTYPIQSKIPMVIILLGKLIGFNIYFTHLVYFMSC